MARTWVCSASGFKGGWEVVFGWLAQCPYILYHDETRDIVFGVKYLLPNFDKDSFAGGMMSSSIVKRIVFSREAFRRIAKAKGKRSSCIGRLANAKQTVSCDALLGHTLLKIARHLYPRSPSRSFIRSLRTRTLALGNRTDG